MDENQNVCEMEPSEKMDITEEPEFDLDQVLNDDIRMWCDTFAEKKQEVLFVLEKHKDDLLQKVLKFEELLKQVNAMMPKPPRHMIHFCNQVIRQHKENVNEEKFKELDNEYNRVQSIGIQTENLMIETLKNYKTEMDELTYEKKRSDIYCVEDPKCLLVEKLKNLYSAFLMAIGECPLDVSCRNSDYCEVCDQPLSFYQSEGCLCCPFCGTSKKYIDPAPVGGPAHVQDESMGSMLGIMNTKKTTQYREWLALSFQVRCPVIIPDAALKLIMAKLIEIGITNSTEITIAEIRKVLKLTGGKAYYNHITQITCDILGIPYPKMSTAVELRLVSMYAAIQDPYDKILNGNRKEFPPPTTCTLFFLFLLNAPELNDWLPLLIDKSKRSDQVANFVQVCNSISFQQFNLEQFEKVMSRFMGRTKNVNVRRRPTIRISKTALVDLGPIQTTKTKRTRKTNPSNPSNPSNVAPNASSNVVNEWVEEIRSTTSQEEKS